MPPLPGTSDSAASYVNCQGQPVVSIACYDSFSYVSSPFLYIVEGSAYFVKFYLHDSLVYTSDTIGCDEVYYSGVTGNYVIFNPTDTGLYTYKIFLYANQFGYYDSLHFMHVYGISTAYDTLCPADSGTIYVTNSTVPFPYVKTASECFGILATPPLLTIYGGSIPYTVEMPGIDTFVMNTNTAVFPYTALGTYNVIAYDNCGISRSFTFTINDTCACLIPSSLLSVSNTGLTYHFTDSLLSGTGPIAFSWNFGDGTLTADSQNVSHTFQIPLGGTTDTITLIVSDSCGSDTLTRVITIPMGIENIQSSMYVSVYPNPNQGSFTIGVNSISSTSLTAEVTDMLGRNIYKQNIHTGENKFDLSLTSGVYTVKVSDGNTSTVRMMTIR